MGSCWCWGYALGGFCLGNASLSGHFARCFFWLVLCDRKLPSPEKLWWSALDSFFFFHVQSLGIISGYHDLDFWYLLDSFQGRVWWISCQKPIPKINWPEACTSHWNQERLGRQKTWVWKIMFPRRFHKPLMRFCKGHAFGKPFLSTESLKLLAYITLLKLYSDI